MKIICLGDSLTAGCGLRRGENWVELLREQTGDEWINAGVCGDTSTGILVRLQTEVLPQRPDEVLLMGGDNDIMLTGCADQAKSAMMAMIHQCAARGVKPVVGIQFPVLGIPEPWRAVCDWERAQAESAAYIAWLRRLVRAVSLLHVDFAEAFERCGGRALYQADGMHPNAEGNRVMADAVRRALRRGYSHPGKPRPTGSAGVEHRRQARTRRRTRLCGCDRP